MKVIVLIINLDAPHPPYAPYPPQYFALRSVHEDQTDDMDMQKPMSSPPTKALETVFLGPSIQNSIIIVCV